MGTATHPSNRKVRLAVLAGGLAFLAMGIAYYHAFREVGSVYFGAILGLHNGATGEEFAPWLPSFLHTLAFSLMTAAVVWDNFRHVLIGCVSWGLINVAFEITQLSPPAGLGWAGHFDFGDILAAIAGCVLAISLTSVLHQERREK